MVTDWMPETSWARTRSASDRRHDATRLSTERGALECAPGRVVVEIAERRCQGPRTQLACGVRV